MSTPEVFVYASGDLLASAAAARTVTRLADAIAAQRHAHLVLTGGGIGTKVLAAIAAAPARDAVDGGRWTSGGATSGSRPPGTRSQRDRRPRRPARRARRGPVPGARGPGPRRPDGDDPDAAAARYAAELAEAAEPGRAAVPVFDILMLGIGPEGHVASIFPSPRPRTPGFRRRRPNSPKPPPTRISLTFSAIQAAREVWILASGAEKAEAVAEALCGVSQDKLPAAGARGRDRTLFLTDEAAAAKLPPA